MPREKRGIQQTLQKGYPLLQRAYWIVRSRLGLGNTMGMLYDAMKAKAPGLTADPAAAVRQSDRSAG